jgi:hypothetical protein
MEKTLDSDFTHRILPDYELLLRMPDGDLAPVAGLLR